jgi:hypothetical protein
MDGSILDLMKRIMPGHATADAQAYKVYAAEAQALGQQPLPLAQWLAGGKQPVARPAPAPVAPPAPAPGATPGNPAGIQF